MSKDITTKIQINTLEGLKELIKNDSEIEVKVKESIINGFCKHYLKGCANSEVIKNLKDVIMDELKETNYFGLYKESGLSWKKEYVISNDLKAKIEREVTSEINNVFGERLKSEMDMLSKRFELKIEDYVESRFKDTIDKTIEKIINRKIGEAFRHMLNK